MPIPSVPGQCAARFSEITCAPRDMTEYSISGGGWNSFCVCCHLPRERVHRRHIGGQADKEQPRLWVQDCIVGQNSGLLTFSR